ncbi:hypothetical protein [Candidatus Albibeggiatoa sp. nov. BB20]|uniref:hypothetical protein n=1 Tax=Candidatus Albibeggiatoa sp. nov. BB20 TaxID=3162723 RepID=UPI003365A065
MARGLWDFLLPEYRQCATIYTDFWEAYQSVLPSKRLHTVGKKTGQHRILRDLTVFLDRMLVVLPEKTSPSPNLLKTILKLFGILFIIYNMALFFYRIFQDFNTAHPIPLG